MKHLNVLSINYTYTKNKDRPLWFNSNTLSSDTDQMEILVAQFLF